ncbi:MAG: hypothetical protein ABIR11_00070 [Candidatus Limnocylindrales bacterium]
MRILRLVLLALSLPAGLAGFVLGGKLVALVSLPDWLYGIVALFVPLLIGGLFMVPFIVLFFDNMAKRDLAAHRASEEAKADAASALAANGTGPKAANAKAAGPRGRSPRA